MYFFLYLNFLCACYVDLTALLLLLSATLSLPLSVHPKLDILSKDILNLTSSNLPSATTTLVRSPSYSTPGPVSTGMGDCMGVQLLVWEIYLSLTNHPGQLSLAIPPWVGAMSTGQRAVMLCDWD